MSDDDNNQLIKDFKTINRAKRFYEKQAIKKEERMWELLHIKTKSGTDVI